MSETINKYPKISVIVPVYNVEAYVGECIDSILKQTYENLEIILVDDGSTDSSGRICDEYAKKDSRVKVYHKENGGLSDARNYGIEKSSGDFLSFIDGDDWIDKDMYSKMIETSIKDNSDIVVCGITKDYVGRSVDSHSIDECISGYDALKRMFYGKNLNHSACDKIYKKRVFDNVRFPKGEIYEDLRTTYKSVINANTVSTIKNCFYHYRMREGSISKGKFKESRFEVLPALKSVMENEDIKRHTELIDILKNRELLLKSNLIWNIALYTSDDDYNKYKSFLKENYNELKSNRRLILKDDRFSKYMKIVSMAPDLIVPLIRNMMNVKSIKGKYSSTHEFYK